MTTPETPEIRFGRLHDEHFETVRRYAWRRDPPLADDIVAETFVVAWRRLDGIPADARPWLIGVARHVRLNLVRARRRQEAVASELWMRQGRGEPQDEPVAPELAPALRAALASLSPLDREVLLLHAWDELERDEIAAALGCSKANASVRLHRAKRRFRAALDAASESHNAALITSSEGATDGC